MAPLLGPPAPPTAYVHYPILYPPSPQLMPAPAPLPWPLPQPPPPLLFLGARSPMSQPPTAVRAELRLMMEGLAARMEAIDRSMAALHQEYCELDERFTRARGQLSGGGMGM